VRNKFSVSFDRLYRKTYKKTDADQLRHKKIYIHNQNNALKMEKQISYAKKVWVLLTSAPGALVKKLKRERKENICIEKTKI
jgi:hypothetical protein